MFFELEISYAVSESVKNRDKKINKLNKSKLNKRSATHLKAVSGLC